MEGYGLRNILMLVEEKKKSDSEFLSYNLMLNSGEFFLSPLRDKNNKYSDSCCPKKKF
jgi:hypothetical protein